MQKRKQKFLSFLLVLALIICSVPAFSLSAIADGETSGKCGDNLTWEYNPSTYTLTISGTGDMWDFSFPDYSPWTSYHADILAVNIGSSVTGIGEYAFGYCSELISIDIPNSVTRIGGEAFISCTGLISITIPSNVTSIDRDAFCNCGALESITVVEDNTDYYSEGNCLIEKSSNKLILGCKNSVIPNSVTSIGIYAFRDCIGLTSITIPSSITSIEKGAFENCSGLESITVVEGNTNYLSEGNCLIEKSSNKLILGCKNSVIPNSVTSIGSNAFRGCIGLTSITIPSSITSIENGAFENCSGLESIVVDEDNINYYGWGNCLIEIENDALILGCKNSSIPYGVRSIGDGAFEYCSGLTSITIPSGVTNIGRTAFYCCFGLTSIIISDTVTSIGDDAFTNCHKLSDVCFVGNQERWQSIVIASSNSDLLNANRRYIDDFDFCGDNLIWEYDSITETLTITGTGDMDSYGWYSYGGYWGNVSNVIIGNNVTSIGNYAFQHFTGLTSIEIPNSVTSIGDGAFEYCSRLTSLTIGNSVTSIGNYAFGGCVGLTSIEIPNSVTSIGDGAFSNCAGLTSVKIGNSVTSIGDEAFYDCAGLTSIKIGNSVTSIGYGAFANCVRLTKIEIPNSVTSIGDRAFYYCSRLMGITIGNGLTNIGYGAFGYCNKLKDVYYYGTQEQWNTVANDADINATIHLLIKGDVNCDNKIDANDISQLISIVLGREQEISSADLNNDGKIDILDLVELKKYISNP